MNARNTLDPDEIRVSSTLALLASALGVVGLRLVHSLAVSSDPPLARLCWIAPAVVLSLVGSALLIAAYWEMHRASHTNSGAVSLVLILSLPTIFVTVEAFAAFTTFWWERGALTATSPAGPDLWAVERYYAWHLIDAVPLLEINETVGWGRPVDFTDQWSGALLLVFKLLLIAPIVGVVIGCYRFLQSHQVRRSLERAERPEFEIDERSGLAIAGGIIAESVRTLVYWIPLLRYPLITYGALVLLMERPGIVPNLFGAAVILMLTLWCTFIYRIPIDWSVTHTWGSLAISASLVVRRIVAFTMGMFAVCAITMLFLHVGLADTEETLGAGEELGATLTWYGVNLAEIVPFLEVPATLDWTSRVTFVDGWSRSFLLLLRLELIVVLFLPLMLLLRLYVEDGQGGSQAGARPT